MSRKDHRAVELIELGDKLWSDKKQYDGLNQEIAWNFCPDLASFTTKLVLGQDFQVDQMDSVPQQLSRELSNQLSAILRPNDRPWFRTTTLQEEVDADEEAARVLEYVTTRIRQGLYDPRSKFIRSTKLADRFYTNFGMGVISVEEAPKTRDHLFFRSFHIKNCAWMENDLGEVDHLHRKEMLTARRFARRFAGDDLAPEIKRAAEKSPNMEFEQRVIIMPADEYDETIGGKGVGATRRYRKSDRLPFVAIYVDVSNTRIIREEGLRRFIYAVPRWSMFADSQYAFSPCAMIGLGDARMSHTLAQIIMESGEKALDPPLLAKQEVVIGEPNIQAGGISWIDVEHDDNLKNALDALKIDPNMTVGFEMRKDLREVLSKAFFIDKLALPDTAGKKTAYEVGRLLEEHVRNLLPLFEPMQVEYNTRVLDLSYGTMLDMHKFSDGPPIPQILKSRDITWSFQSPIQQMQEQVMIEQFKGSLELVGLGMQAGAKANPLNVDKALRDGIRGTGAPASWRKTKAEMDQEAEQIAKEKAVTQAMQELHGGADVVHKVGDAAGSIADTAQKVGLLPPPSQKVVQGQAGGNPEQAGRLGLPAPDVGDQGPAATENSASPAPWQPEQVQAVLGAGMPSSAAQQPPTPPQMPQPSAPVQQPRLHDVVSMQNRAFDQLDQLDKTARDLAKLVDEPKRITERVDKLAETLSKLSRAVAEPKHITDKIDQLEEAVSKLSRAVGEPKQIRTKIDELTETVSKLSSEVSESKGIASQVDKLAETVTKLSRIVKQPKRIVVERDENGLIKGAKVEMGKAA